MITEDQIRFAMSNTKSNKEAARFLKVAFNTYKKYAKEYIHPDKGISYFDIHLNTKENKSNQIEYKSYKNMSLESILTSEGRKSPITDWKLRDMLIENQYKIDKCDLCDFDLQRQIDGTVPLILNYIDNDKHNRDINNIQFVCCNCYYLYIGDIIGDGKV